MSDQIIFHGSEDKAKKIKFWPTFIFPFLILVVFVIFQSIHIVHFAQEQNINSQHELFDNPPDLVSVFTGDGGRIRFIFEKLANSSTQYLITGVHQKNTVEKLIKERSESPNSIDSNQIEIDYLANNTFENVLSTALFMRKRNDLKKVLIVSSDYHLYRIDQIVQALLSKFQETEIYYQGVPSNYSELRTYRLILREVVKTVQTWFFLLFWDSERPVKVSP